MENFKNKLFNFQARPPEGMWEKIVKELDETPHEVNDPAPLRIPGIRGRSRLLYYGMTAAASLLILFFITIFFKNKKENKSLSENTHIIKARTINKQIKDSIELNNRMLERIIETPDKQLIASNLHKQKKYITIAGPEGQPVKISPKAATLIVSADDEFPPKPVWSKKIDKWKKIMLSSTNGTTATNLVDILELSANNETIE